MNRLLNCVAMKYPACTRKGAILPLVGLLGLAVCSQGQVASDAKKQIVAELRAGDFSGAEARLSEVLKGSPGDASLWTLNGYALLHLEKPKQALAAYERALEIAPDYAAALEGAAEIDFAAGDQRAVPLLERLLKIHPDDQTAHAMLATLAYKRKDCSAAVKEFEQAKTAIDGKIQALHEYGYCSFQTNGAAESLPIFQRLVELQPQSERARYNLAVVQSAAKHYQEAIATVTGPNGKLPENAEALDLLADAYEETADTPHAVAILRLAIVKQPEVAKYYIDFANICLIHASFQVGIDMLNAGLSRMPHSGALYLARGILYVQMGQYDKSEQDFASAAKFDPNLAYGESAAGLAELQQDNLVKAEATVRERLQKHPNDAFSYYLLAETLLRKGATPGSADFSEALHAAQRAVQLDSKFALGRDVLGRLYLQQGKLAEAIQQSRLAFQDDPTDQTALYHLIMALRKGGKTEEIPALAKKLAELRQQAQRKEASERKYSLVEVNPAPAPK